MAGAGMGGVPVEPGHRGPGRVHQRVLELIGAGVERGRRGVVAAVVGLARGDPVGGVQHRDALGGADGQVEVRHPGRALAAFGRTDLVELSLAGAGMLRQVRGHRRLLPFPGHLRLVPCDQLLATGAGALPVQAGDHVRVDLTGQPERGDPFPGPFAGWFPGRGVVRHRPGAAAVLRAGGEVGDVVAGVQRPVSGHGPCPSAPPGPRSSCVMPVSDRFRSRREAKRGPARFADLPRGWRPGRSLCAGRRKPPGLPWQGHESGKLGAEMSALFALRTAAVSETGLVRPCKRRCGVCRPLAVRCRQRPGLRRRLPRVPAPRRPAPPDHRGPHSRQPGLGCQHARAVARTAPGRQARTFGRYWPAGPAERWR